MRGKIIIIGVLVLLLLGICAASVFAVFTGLQMVNISDVQIGANNVSAKATEEKLLQVDGAVSLDVQNDFGSILVSSSADGQVRVTAEKTAWGNNQQEAEAALKDVEVVVEQAGNTVRISVKRPNGNAVVIGKYQPASVNFVIETPIQTRTTLNSNNGNVTVEGLTGSADISSAFGQLEIRNLTGALQASTNNGAILADAISSSDGILLESDFGSIELTNSDADEVTVRTSNGSVTLRDVVSRGKLNADSEFGDIRIKGGEAQTLAVESSNGALELEDLNVQTSLKAKSLMGAISLTGVSAMAYDLQTENGKVSLDEAQGSIKARSAFGDVEVTNADLAVLDISSDNGTLTFSGSLADADQTLESSMGNISLTIQPDASLDLDLETSMGKISSNFAVTLNGEIDSSHWVGSINGGGGKLSVTTQNGNITLNKSK